MELTDIGVGEADLPLLFFLAFSTVNTGGKLGEVLFGLVSLAGAEWCFNLVSFSSDRSSEACERASSHSALSVLCCSKLASRWDAMPLALSSSFAWSFLTSSSLWRRWHSISYQSFSLCSYCTTSTSDFIKDSLYL